MCKWQRNLPWVSDETLCTGGTQNPDLEFGNFYWSSSEGKGFFPEGGFNDAWSQPMSPDNDGQANYWVKGASDGVRPIRAFGAFAPSSVPSFSLSKSAETIYARTTPIIGYTITSSGGTITSYSISPSVSPGLTFNTTTGLLSGTPTETRTTTMYTITGSNSSGSATETFILRVAGSIGDIGPGGGTIYYVSNTPFACGPARASMCSYLEVAPNWWAWGNDPERSWASVEESTTPVNNPSSPQTATATGIGWGYWNTRAIMDQGNIDPVNSAAALANSYGSEVNGIEFYDWFLPSKDELNQIWVGLGVGFLGVDPDFFYWSSSENGADSAWEQDFDAPGHPSSSEKSEELLVRPVRAF
jgi:hypothetical protein